MRRLPEDPLKLRPDRLEGFGMLDHPFTTARAVSATRR